MSLSNAIEAILFYEGGAVLYGKIARLLDEDIQAIKESIISLKDRYQGTGLMIIETIDSVAIATDKEQSAVIVALRKEELEGPLSKASEETLTAILYCGPIEKAKIDYIRGVNSGAILRALSARGLISRSSGNNLSGYSYSATPDLLAYLGLTKENDLPDFEATRARLSNITES